MMIKKHIVISLLLHLITTSLKEINIKSYKECKITSVCQDQIIYRTSMIKIHKRKIRDKSYILVIYIMEPHSLGIEPFK
jgi:hypothetical protein